MIVEMRTRASQKEIDSVVDGPVAEPGFQLNLGTERPSSPYLGAIRAVVHRRLRRAARGGRDCLPHHEALQAGFPGVKPKDSMVSIDGVDIGGKRVVSNGRPMRRGE